MAGSKPVKTPKPRPQPCRRRRSQPLDLRRTGPPWPWCRPPPRQPPSRRRSALAGSSATSRAASERLPCGGRRCGSTRGRGPPTIQRHRYRRSPPADRPVLHREWFHAESVVQCDEEGLEIVPALDPGEDRQLGIVLAACGHLARSDADVSRIDSSNATKAAARPATVFAMPAVGLPSIDPSCAGEGAGTPVP